MPSGGVSFAAPTAMADRPRSAARTAVFEVKRSSAWRVLAIEATATAIVTFLAAGALLNHNKRAAAATGGAVLVDPTSVALATGMAYAAVTHAFAHLSGCHANPAMTVAFLAARLIPFGQAALYIVAQGRFRARCSAVYSWVGKTSRWQTAHFPSPPLMALLVWELRLAVVGSVVGAALLDAVTGRHGAYLLGATLPSQDVSAAEAFGMEFVLAFIRRWQPWA